MVEFAKVGKIGVIVVLVLWLLSWLRRTSISFSQRYFICKQDCPQILRGAEISHDQYSTRLKQIVTVSKRDTQVTQTSKR